MKRESRDSKLTDADYDDMARSYEETPPAADEFVGPVEVNPAVLPTGRPKKGTGPARGRTPTTSVRLPDPLRERLNDRAAREHVAPAEVIRRALVEYLDAETTKTASPSR